MNLVSGFDQLGFADVAVVAAVCGEAAVTAGMLPLFAVNGAVLVAFNVAEAVFPKGQMAVNFDDFGAVVLGQQVQVFLCVDVDVFFVRFVFEAQFVAAFALMGLGFQGGACFVPGQGAN
jgi:hypothetical protein